MVLHSRFNRHGTANITFSERTHIESFWEGVESLWCLTFLSQWKIQAAHSCLKNRYTSATSCVYDHSCVAKSLSFQIRKDLYYKQLYLHPHAMSQVTIHLQPKKFTHLWVSSLYFTNQKYLKRSSFKWCRQQQCHSQLYKSVESCWITLKNQ